MTVKSVDSSCESPWQTVFNWEAVSVFGRSKVATGTMAAPFIGYIILYHSSIEQYLGGFGGLVGMHTAPGACSAWLSGWQKLNFTYVALVILGVGSILFRLTAPKVIKLYGNVYDYLDREIPRATAGSLRTIYSRSLVHHPDKAEALLKRAAWLDSTQASLKTASDTLQAGRDDQLKIDILTCYYDVLDRHTMRPAVYATTVLYGVGFALLSLPGLDLTRRVVCVMLN